MIRTSLRCSLLGLIALPFIAHAQTNGACTTATLTGTYSLTATGRAVNSSMVLISDYQGVGTVTFDGVSAVTANLTVNSNLAAGIPTKLSGTYTIPSTCVGTVNFTVGDMASFQLIPYNNGNDFILAGEDATYTFTASGAMQPASCVTATLSGAYAFSGTGVPLASGLIGGTNDISGLLQFDGAGNMTGTWAVANSANSTPDTISGHYTMSGCTGSATATDPAGAGYTLTFSMTAPTGASFALLGATSTNIFTGTGHSTFVNPGGAVGGAAGSGGTAPGGLFSVYGFNLANATPAQPTTDTYPTTLGGANVMVNGTEVPLSYTSAGQINAQMPWDTPAGVATLTVKTSVGTSNAVAVTIPSTASPGIFVSGANRAIAQNYPSYNLNSPATPAPAGSVVIVYLTGGGPVTGENNLTTGKAAPNGLFPVTEPYSATIAGTNATVDFVGLTPGFIGLYQANIVVPKIAAGDHNLIITIGGVNSTAVTISTS